jgi:two-component system sensor histidine kinase PilS (NtrC family)
MKVSLVIQKNQQQGVLVEFLRVSLYLVVLAVGVISGLFQSGFLNWDLMGPFYGLICVGLGLHLIWVSFWERLMGKSLLLFTTFVVDALLLSFLIYYSGFNQSLFLFLHLVNILVAGMVFQSAGALGIAAFTSIFFTAAAIFSPEMKALQFLFLLALNNIAFFSVAGLSGYLSEQLQTVGRELRKTDRSLRSVQELNQVIMSNIPTGMLTFLDNGEIIQANPSASLTLQNENLVGKKWQELFPHVQSSDKVLKQDVKYKNIEGERILALTLSRIHSAELGQNISIALLDDMTRVRELEQSARQNEKLAAVGGLAAGIAHEIRNPLAGISGSIEMLSQTVTSDDDRKLMKIVLREIDRLNNLITEFLDYARPETPPTDAVDISTLLRDVLESMKRNAQVRADVVQDVQIADHVKILGKRDKLQQAFLNIVINAYQAMSDSATAILKVQVREEADKVVVRLKDSGSGMSESTLKRMFEPFHTTKPKGTGLGLAVTHKILEGHQALIVVNSSPGTGTEFVLFFPKMTVV